MASTDHDLPADDGTDYLARGAQRGDQARFRALYERMAPAIYSWARLRMPPDLRAVVGPEDIVQEVWLRAIGTLQGFDTEQGPFRRWIFGVTRNVWLKAIRTGAAEAAHGTKGGRFDPGEVPEEATAVSLRASRHEGVQALIVACAALTAGDRELLMLRGLEGRTHDEVASELGVEAATVRKRWQRLREQLEGVTGLGELVEV